MPTDWPNTVGNLVLKHGLEVLRDVLVFHAHLVIQSIQHIRPAQWRASSQYCERRLSRHMQISTMSDMHLVAIRITQIRTVVTVTIVRALARFTFIGSTRKKPSCIGGIYRIWRGCSESHHAAISCSGLIAVIRVVYIKARERAVWLNPARRRWPAIWGYRPTTEPQGDQHRVVEGRRLIKIVCPNGYVTEHPVFLLTKARRYRVILKVGVYSGRRVRRRGRVSVLQIAGKEKPAMGVAGLKGCSLGAGVTISARV